MKSAKFYKIFYAAGIPLFAAAAILYAVTGHAGVAAVFAAALAVHVAFYFFKHKLMNYPNESARAVTLSYTFLLAAELLASVGFFALYGSFAVHTAGGAAGFARYIAGALCIAYAVLRYFISAVIFLKYLLNVRAGLLNGGMPKRIARAYAYTPLAVFCIFGAALTAHLITQSYFGPLWLAAVFAMYALFTGLCLVCTSGQSTFASAIWLTVLALAKCIVPILVFNVFVPGANATGGAAWLAACVMLYIAVCAGAVTDAAAIFYAARDTIKERRTKKSDIT